MNKFIEVREAFANQKPAPNFIGDKLCLYTDQYVESLRFRIALPLLVNFGKRYKARPYSYPVHGRHTDRCFDSAYALALHDSDTLYYCEGFLCYREEELVLSHGWCMTRDGRIVDPTLYAHQDTPGITYYGFPLRLDYVTAWYEKYGYVGLLDGHRDGEPVGIHYDDSAAWLEPTDWRRDE